MPRVLDYKLFNEVLTFIQEPKNATTVSEHFKIHDRVMRKMLYRLIDNGYAKSFKIGVKPTLYQATADHVPEGGMKKYITRKEKEREEAKVIERQYEWKPNMIVRPNSDKRLQRLHAETAELRRREMKQLKQRIYIGCSLDLMGAIQ